MRILFFIFAFVFCLTASVRAEILYLKDGNTVQGEILQQDDLTVTIRPEKGFPQKYYVSQIEEIKTEAALAEQEGPSELLTYNSFDFPDISEEKFQLILGLLEAMNIPSTLEKNFQKVLAKAPVDRQEDVRKLFNIRDILTRIVPLYDQHYSKEELKEIALFLKSKTGQHFMDTAPKLTQETIQILMNYFQEKAQTLPRPFVTE